MDRHRERAQYVEGCHMTDVQSDFEGHSPTVIVIFIARSFFTYLKSVWCCYIAHKSPSTTVSQNRSHPVVGPRHSPVEDPHGHGRRASIARLLCTHGKSRLDVPAFELTPASSKHCTRLAYPPLPYTAREGRSSRRQKHHWFCSECMAASYNPRFLVNTRSPIITADWVLLPRGTSTS